MLTRAVFLLPPAVDGFDHLDCVFDDFTLLCSDVVVQLSTGKRFEAQRANTGDVRALLNHCLLNCSHIFLLFSSCLVSQIKGQKNSCSGLC